jgi:biopolymer transport protein ExbD
MPKVKIPRKSTYIDMTAMCDVAFLLLSFFILATKQKPPEVLEVQTPSSVSSKAVPDKSIIVTLTADGRTFLMLGDDTKKADVIDNINSVRGLGLGPAELAKLKKQEPRGYQQCPGKPGIV